MAMTFEQSFVIRASPDAVWEYLTDPHRAARALPGAQVTEKIDDRTFAGTMTVKVGPVSAKYQGRAVFEQLDAGSRTAEIAGTGRDVRGRGGADMKMKSQVLERGPGETEVRVATEVKVTGILAQVGRGMIQDVSDQLFRRFADGVRADLEAPETPGAEPSEDAAPEAEALDAVALGRAVAGNAVRRWARRPALWVAAAIAAAAAYWIATR